MAFPADNPIWAALEAADEAGIKLEMVGGLPVWEAMPGLRHQKAVFRIQNSVTRESGHDCGCATYADVSIQFPDGSFKRPDISIFCREPDEQVGAITLLPEAVIEVISPGYESKDYEVGLPFYLKAGIKDIVIFDPSRNHVLYARADGQRELVSPVTLQLACGCVCTV